MKKSYFSGGTVAASIADIDFFKRREGIEEYFEDGTISFLSIASLHHGFNIFNTLTMSAISRHTLSLATYVKNRLLDLRHANGQRVCTLYGLRDPEVLCNKTGPTISFNLKRPDGSWVGHREVEKLASLSGIQLRTGCFCNPGACSKYLGLSHSDLLSNTEAGHICWDDQDVMNGKPTGAVRVSFGYMSTYEDTRKFLRFIENGFILPLPESTYLNSSRMRAPVTEDIDRAAARLFLKSITIYPIKSCSGFSVDSWPLTRTGLLYDREWLLKSLNGEILTQKKVPDMCYITTLIDLNLGALVVESPRCKEKLQIKLTSYPSISGEEMELHSQRYEVRAYGDEVDIWFSKAVGRHCTLLRSSGSQPHLYQNGHKSPGICRDLSTSMNFVNEAQFLLISEGSVADLNNRLRSKLELQNGSHGPLTEVTPMRFRPNLVISGGEPYIEDSWRNLKIEDNFFTSLGGCNRCQMINLNATSGEVQRSKEPLATLATYRRVKGKICFGLLLRYEESSKQDARLSVGQEIYANIN